MLASCAKLGHWPLPCDQVRQAPIGHVGEANPILELVSTTWADYFGRPLLLLSDM